MVLHPWIQFSSVQSLSCVRLFATSWTAARQASLSITNSWSLLKLMSLSRWCHPTISSSDIPFSSHLQSFPASGSFPVSQLFASSGQSIEASASVLPMNIQSWFPLGLADLISLNICMVVKYMYTCSCLRSDIKQRRRNLLSLCFSLVATLNF